MGHADERDRGGDGSKQHGLVGPGQSEPARPGQIETMKNKFISTALLIVGVLAAGVESETAFGQQATWCNPLPLPDYPVGRLVRDAVNGERTDGSSLWLLDHKEQFRELADPTAVWHEGKWYLYPSCDMAWVSADNGATWQHHPLNIRDVGYAPTVVRHGGKFYLMASDSPLYVADGPLGPFESLGQISLPRRAGAEEVPGQTDPMLFSDEGKLFFYWGCTPTGGIWGVELDAKNLTKIVGVPVRLIQFSPAQHPWEAVGDWNQDPSTGWVEGSWMIKRNGTYYLTFSAAGTENRTYAMGCYVGKSPLGEFTAQKRNPILRATTGLVTGTGHGCIVAGPEDKLFAFYTIRAAVVHGFERRLGMDRAEIDAKGELYVPAATSTPQCAAGAPNSGDPGWLALNGGMQTLGSTSAENLQPRFAVDEDMRTWWQPADGDKQPTLTSRLPAAATVRAVRVIWRDVGLNTTKGVMPGPIRYRVELETGKVRWQQDSFGAAVLTLAGDRLVILTEKGELIRAPASPESFKTAFHAQILSSQARAHPALADGLFYARSKDKLVCVDLRKAQNN